MHSILIQVPDASHGVLMLGPGDFVAEGTSVLSDDSYVDKSISTDDTKFVRISYDEIVDGKFFFASQPDAVGRISNLEFKVTDSIQSTNNSGDIEFNPGLDSFDTGLIELTITGAPKSLDESLKDAQYTRSFEAEIGSGRFESFDRLLQSVDMTREAGLAFISELQDENAGNGHSSRPKLPSFTKIADLDEVTYRWEINWLSSNNDTSSKSINQLTNLGTLSTIDLATRNDDFLTNDDLAKELLNSLAALSFGSLTANDANTIQLISNSFDPDGNVDKTYENLTFAGGPLFNDAPTLDQDLIIRAFSTLASIDEREVTSEASSDGNITLKFEDTLADVTDVNTTRSLFKVTVNGTPLAPENITAISNSGNTITLTLADSAKIQNNVDFSVSYTGNVIKNTNNEPTDLSPDRRSSIKSLLDLLTRQRESIQGATGTVESNLYPNHLAEAFQAKVEYEKNLIKGVMGQSFDTSNLSKEGLESLSIMQQVVPNAQSVFSEAENKINNANIEDVQVNFSSTTGRMSFVSTEGGSSVPLRTDNGIFTQEFYDDESITGDVVKAAAVTELQNIRFATAEQNAPSAITQSLDFMLQGVSQLSTDSEENSSSAKTEAANAMNLSTSLQAFSNSIPAEFGSAPGTSYNSSLVFNFKIKVLI